MYKLAAIDLSLAESRGWPGKNSSAVTRSITGLNFR
jgi:hypothetical protein